jgi:hypothetical protein
MGRADQTTKVRAMFVNPKQVNDLAELSGFASFFGLSRSVSGWFF